MMMMAWETTAKNSSNREDRVDIIIPTLGRVNRQETAKHLTRAGLPFTLVVQRHEAHLYPSRSNSVNGYTLRILPDHIRTIAPTRDWIIENVGASRNIVMVDDDLKFFVRRTDDRTKLRDMEPNELVNMFAAIDFQLAICAHVGIAAREGANRNTGKFLSNTRIMRVLGYDRRILAEEGLKFSSMGVMEDFHIALSLLEKGYPNVVLNDYANNQFGSDTSGGCSGVRTADYQRQAAEGLAALHPQFVTVVQKTTKSAWGGGTRTDVRIQWKEAYKHGKSLNGTGLVD